MKSLVFFVLLILSVLMVGKGLSQEVCNPPHAVVLIYHHVSEESPASTSVIPEVFEEHLDFLADNGFRVMALPAVVEAIKNGQDLPDSVVVFTFDDGYESVYSQAFPRLKARGWPFTVFVCPNAIDQHRGPVLDWDQLREMQEAGASVANHGMYHEFLNRSRPGEDPEAHIERLESELKSANKRLAEEGLKVEQLLAYPYGEYSPEVQALIKRLGWTAFGQQSGVVSPLSDFTCLPRFPMAAEFASLNDFGLKVSSLPLPIMEMVSVNPSLDSEIPLKTGPLLKLTLDVTCLNPESVSAFASAQGAIDCNWLDTQQGIVEIIAPNPLPRGRSRYNVTAPVPGSKRWYWFSQNWISGTDHQY